MNPATTTAPGANQAVIATASAVPILCTRCAAPFPILERYTAAFDALLRDAREIVSVVALCPKCARQLATQDRSSTGPRP